jgi:quercetin dioxygenase-like cupin family protein
MRFILTGEETDGEVLRVESLNPPSDEVEPLHVHPFQESSSGVTSGHLRFLVGGEETLLGPGDAITIPPGTPHCFSVSGAEEARSIAEFRPALRIADFFRTYFELAERGDLDGDGKPSLLRSALLGPEFADEIRLVSPPWPLQRLVYFALGPLARMRGLKLP